MNKKGADSIRMASVKILVLFNIIHNGKPVNSLGVEKIMPSKIKLKGNVW